MGKRWALGALILFVGLLFGVRFASADTGGSMGGGDWSSSSSSSGGGGYSSSSSSSSFSSSDSDYSSSNGWSSSSSSGSSSSDPPSALFIIAVIVIALVWFAASVSQSNNSMSSSYTPSYTPIDSVDVSVLRIAVDGRARKFVQSELKRIGGIANTATADGRATMLREVALLLRRLRDAWVYGGAVNEPMRDISAAKPQFDQLVMDARARFREETVRNEQGTKTATAASSYTPRSDEGAGIILVSIVIAARRELFTVSAIGNGDDLRQALDAASQLTPASLVAIEIVWQPSEDEDRLSSMELEAKYPRPDLIPITGALVGKTFCTYCGGPFPAELVSCPHCGAPAPGRDHAAA